MHLKKICIMVYCIDWLEGEEAKNLPHSVWNYKLDVIQI